jgi:hypothetical protein
MAAPNHADIERDQRRALDLGADSIRCGQSARTDDARCLCTCSAGRCAMADLVEEHERAIATSTR